MTRATLYLILCMMFAFVSFLGMTIAPTLGVFGMFSIFLTMFVGLTVWIIASMVRGDV